METESDVVAEGTTVTGGGAGVSDVVGSTVGAVTLDVDGRLADVSDAVLLATSTATATNKMTSQFTQKKVILGEGNLRPRRPPRLSSPK